MASIIIISSVKRPINEQTFCVFLLGTHFSIHLCHHIHLKCDVFQCFWVSSFTLWHTILYTLCVCVCVSNMRTHLTRFLSCLFDLRMCINKVGGDLFWCGILAPSAEIENVNVKVMEWEPHEMAQKFATYLLLLASLFACPCTVVIRLISLCAQCTHVNSYFYSVTSGCDSVCSLSLCTSIKCLLL